MKIVIDIEDPRPLMEWDQPYRLLSASRCSACGGFGVTRKDLTITRHEFGNPLVPLGRLYLRCPEHQRQRDLLQRAAA